MPELYDPVTQHVEAADRRRHETRRCTPSCSSCRTASPTKPAPKTRHGDPRPSGTGSWTTGPTAPWSTSGYSESAGHVPARQDPPRRWWRPAHRPRRGHRHERRRRPRGARSTRWRFARRRMNLTILADGTVMAIGGTGIGGQRGRGRARRRDLGPGHRDVDDGRLDGRGTDVPLVGGAAAGRPGRRRGRRGRRPAASPDLLAAVSLQGCPADDLGRRRAPPPTGSTFTFTSPERGRPRVGRAAAPVGGDPRDRHEPALRAADLQPLRDHDHGHGAGIGRRGAARRLHARREELGRRAVGRLVDPDRLVRRASSPAAIAGTVTRWHDARRRSAARPSRAAAARRRRTRVGAYTLAERRRRRGAGDDRCQRVRDRGPPGRGDGRADDHLDVADVAARRHRRSASRTARPARRWPGSRSATRAA